MTIKLFDTHCHLDLPPLGESSARVIAAARSAGVSDILIPACGVHNWERVIGLADSNDGIYYALGLHPYFLSQHQQDHLALLEQHLSHARAKCVAVGECGLDFFSGSENQAWQTELLVAQLKLANHYRLPVILHCRKAQPQLVKLLKQHPLHAGGVLHGFTGSYQQAMELVRLGLHIGVGGSITYQRANKTRQAIAKLPLSCLVLETDAPDMPLCGYQGQANLPARLPEVLKSLNLLRSECEQTVASTLYVNSKRLFCICE